MVLQAIASNVRVARDVSVLVREKPNHVLLVLCDKIVELEFNKTLQNE